MYVQGFLIDLYMMGDKENKNARRKVWSRMDQARGNIMNEIAFCTPKGHRSLINTSMLLIRMMIMNALMKQLMMT